LRRGNGRLKPGRASRFTPFSAGGFDHGYPGPVPARGRHCKFCM
jgi:hypothetical protein